MKLLAEQVVRRPLLTEKNTKATDKRNAYAFEVVPQASKTDVKAAIEKLFGVTVVGVRTSVLKGLERRVGYRKSVDANVKKAVVTLKAGDRIDAF